MNIIDNVFRPLTINDIGEGATFKHGYCYYVKLSVLVRDEYGPYNAVRLTDGTPCMFTENDEIFPFNCELIIL